MDSSNPLRVTQLIPILLLMAMAHFLIDVMLGIWPLYKTMVSLDIGLAGLIVGLGGFIGEGSQLLFGSFSDKGYRKLLIVLGLFISLAASFFTYTLNYTALFGLYLLTCLGSGCFHPSAASLVSSISSSRRGLFMTILAAGGSFGMASSQIIFAKTHSWFDGQTYLLAIPGIALGLLIAIYPYPRSVNQNAQAIGSHQVQLKDFIDFFRNRTLRVLYISQIANQSLLWGMIFIMPDMLKTLGHEEWICHGGGHFCLIMGATCMMIPGGYLADLYSVRQIMLIGGVISCVLYYFVLYSPWLHIGLSLSSLFLLGATLALMNPLALSLATRLEPYRTGAVSAFLMGLVWCISEPIGPGGVGLLSTMFEENGPIKAMAILGGFFLIQIYATWCLPKGVLTNSSPSGLRQSLGDE